MKHKDNYFHIENMILRWCRRSVERSVVDAGMVVCFLVSVVECLISTDADQNYLRFLASPLPPRRRKNRPKCNAILLR